MNNRPPFYDLFTAGGENGEGIRVDPDTINIGQMSTVSVMLNEGRQAILLSDQINFTGVILTPDDNAVEYKVPSDGFVLIAIFSDEGEVGPGPDPENPPNTGEYVVELFEEFNNGANLIVEPSNASAGQLVTGTVHFPDGWDGACDQMHLAVNHEGFEFQPHPSTWYDLQDGDSISFIMPPANVYIYSSWYVYPE